MHDAQKKTVGETFFAAAMLLVSLILLWQAYSISGFEALSAPGSFPMGVTLVMVVSSASIALRTLSVKSDPDVRLWTDVLPPVILIMTALIVLYAVLLQPLGFLPTSFLFLAVSIWFLWRRGPVRSIGIALLSLIGIYVIFRLVFSVLMPAGIVPEGEILAWFGNLVSERAAQ